MKLQKVENLILFVRGQKVMLDFHLAELYGVETRVLKQAVRRNRERFPEDFMFELNKSEWKELITTCDMLPANIKFSPSTPFAFTEQGVAMISTVLKSKKAILVNISIMRAFVIMRKYLSDYKDLKEHLQALEKEMNIKFKDIHQAINYLLRKDKKATEQTTRTPIGFKKNKK